MDEEKDLTLFQPFGNRNFNFLDGKKDLLINHGWVENRYKKNYPKA